MASKAQIQKAWDKASKIRGRNPNLWRRDDFGNPMYKPSYGHGGKNGWEIDHIKPKAKGGSDSPRNLRALNTTANRQRGAVRKRR